MGVDVQHYRARAEFLKFTEGGFNVWDWIAEHYNFSHTKTILEIACATGDFWTHVQDKASKVEKITLTERSETMLNAARSALADSPLAPKLNFEIVDPEALKYPNETFDAVLSHHFMLHQPISVPKTLKEKARVLRKDGWLGIATMTMRTITEIFALAHKIDSRFPEQSTLLGHFDEKVVDKIVPKYFNRMQKYSDEIIIKIPSSEVIMGFIRTHPVSLLLGLKEDFFTALQGVIDNIIAQKGFLETAITPTLYICKGVIK